jgi:hypothetical protein
MCVEFGKVILAAAHIKATITREAEAHGWTWQILSAKVAAFVTVHKHL